MQDDDSEKLRPGTVIEMLEFPKKEESSGLMRLKGKVRGREGKTPNIAFVQLETDDEHWLASGSEAREVPENDVGSESHMRELAACKHGAVRCQCHARDPVGMSGKQNLIVGLLDVLDDDS